MEPLSHGDQRGMQDLRHHVRGRDKVDVVAALPFKGEHHTGDLLWRSRMPLPALADRVVLAVLTVQVAPREKDRSRATTTNERRFFPKVRSCTGDDGLLSCTTLAHLSGAAIHPAAARTDVTRLQLVVSDLDALVEFAALEQG